MASNNFTSELECTVCLEIPKVETKVFQCNSGHILCQMCYVKLVVCPTCQKKLGCVSDAEDQYGPIRCLAVENLIRQLPSIPIGQLETIQPEKQKMRVAFQAPEFQMKQFSNKLVVKLPINNKLLEIKLDTEEKGFNVGGLGSTEVFVLATDSKYGVYWGKRLPKNWEGLRRANNPRDQV